MGTEDDNGNSKNRIYEADRDELLIYNGVDTILEFRLAFKQMKQMGIIDPYYYFKKPNILEHTI